jgi:hypothetical protein
MGEFKMALLWIAGIAVVLAGLAAVGFGIPVKEFGFGNTLILTGTIGVCTGLIMLSLAIVVRELKTLVGVAPGDDVAEIDSEPRAAALPKREFEFPLPTGREPEPDDDDEAAPLFSRDQPSADRASDDSAPPWQDEAARARSRAAPVAEDEPAVKRRNLLFSSSRREREAARASEGDAAEIEPAPAEQSTSPVSDRPSFAASWPPVERDRPEPPRRAARAPSTFSEPVVERAVPPPEQHAPDSVTVLKSGVVDGMAYSLYSDGSIEAQMPEGMMRFASIDALREHLDHRG